MKRRAPTRPLFRAPGLLLIAVCALLLIPTAALAVDGTPLFPAGVFGSNSTESPDLDGPMLAFEVFGLSGAPAVKSQTATIHLWNTASAANRRIGLDGGIAATVDQRHPSVLDRNGSVYVVWQQWNDPVTSTRDLWLWRGDEQGTTATGYPRLLVSGPMGSNQYAPALGLSEVNGSRHIVLAWADDRDTGGATTEAYVLDLSADGDRNGVPNYLEASFNPATAGRRADPGGDLVQGQHGVVVGLKGVFWIDDRGAAGSGESDIYRARVTSGAPAVSTFWHNTIYGPVDCVRATGDGAAWLGPGIAGGPFEPWAKKVGGGAGIAAILGNPGVFDVSGSRFALTGGHDGNTDTDPDIYYWDKTARQLVAVCSIGGPFWNRLKVQATPAIAPADGGARIVWADSRHAANTAATDPQALAYTLYVVRTPTVSLSTAKTVVQLGKTVTLSAGVSPKFAGAELRFQTGTKQTFQHAYFVNGTYTWYTNWTELQTRTLSAASRTTWIWKPSHAGTYYIRAWFTGGATYSDGGRLVPHAANASKVVKIVVQ